MLVVCRRSSNERCSVVNLRHHLLDHNPSYCGSENDHFKAEKYKLCTLDRLTMSKSCVGALGDDDIDVDNADSFYK